MAGRLLSHEDGFFEVPFSIPTALNNAGKVVGVSSQFDRQGFDEGWQAVHWAYGRLVNAGNAAKTQGFVASIANAVNASGQMAGIGRYYQDGQDQGTRPIVWSNGHATNLGALSGSDGYSEHTVTGINDAGHVIGYGDTFDNEFAAPVWHAFLWRDAGLQELGNLGVDPSGFTFCTASGINNQDHVVGGCDAYLENGDFKGHSAVLWRDGLTQSLPPLATDPNALPFNEAIAINGQNQIIGYEFLPAGMHCVLWLDGKATDLGVLGVDEFGGETCQPNALNELGQVVGYSSYSEAGVAKGNHAFIYQKGALTDLNTLLPDGSRWLLENALAINNHGQILVYGMFTQGDRTVKAYALLTPKP